MNLLFLCHGLIKLCELCELLLNIRWEFSQMRLKGVKGGFFGFNRVSGFPFRGLHISLNYNNELFDLKSDSQQSSNSIKRITGTLSRVCSCRSAADCSSLPRDPQQKRSLPNSTSNDNYTWTSNPHLISDAKVYVLIYILRMLASSTHQRSKVRRDEQSYRDVQLLTKHLSLSIYKNLFQWLLFEATLP